MSPTTIVRHSGALAAILVMASAAHAAPIPPPLPPDPPKIPTSAQGTTQQTIIRTLRKTCETDSQGKQTCRETASSHGVATPPAALLVIDEFGRRLRDSQADSPLDLLDESALIFEGGHAETKSQYAAQHIKDDKEFLMTTKLLKRERQVQIANDMAVIMTTDILHTPKGNVETAESAVLREMGSHWKITHLHWSSRKVK